MKFYCLLEELGVEHLVVPHVELLLRAELALAGASWVALVGVAQVWEELVHVVVPASLLEPWAHGRASTC